MEAQYNLKQLQDELFKLKLSSNPVNSLLIKDIEAKIKAIENQEIIEK